MSDIVIKVDSLPAARAEKWESRLNAAYHDCGCAAGAVAAIGTLVLGIAYFYMQPGGLRSASAYEYFTLFLLFIFSTGLGKVVGLILAQRRLRRDADALIDEMEGIESKQETKGDRYDNA